MAAIATLLAPANAQASAQEQSVNPVIEEQKNGFGVRLRAYAGVRSCSADDLETALRNSYFDWYINSVFGYSTPATRTPARDAERIQYVAQIAHCDANGRRKSSVVADGRLSARIASQDINIAYASVYAHSLEDEPASSMTALVELGGVVVHRSTEKASHTISHGRTFSASKKYGVGPAHIRASVSAGAEAGLELSASFASEPSFSITATPFAYAGATVTASAGFGIGKIGAKGSLRLFDFEQPSSLSLAVGPTTTIQIDADLRLELPNGKLSIYGKISGLGKKSKTIAKFNLGTLYQNLGSKKITF